MHMRGLPFKATPADIAYVSSAVRACSFPFADRLTLFSFQFFKPLRPMDITIIFDNNDRPSGEADVEFECHDDAIAVIIKIIFLYRLPIYFSFFQK